MKMTATLAAALLAATVLAAPSFAQNACVGENCPPAAPQAAPAAPQPGQQPVTGQAPVIQQGKAAPKAGEQMQSAQPELKPGEKPADSQAAAPKQEKQPAEDQAAAPKAEDGSQSAEAQITTEKKEEIRSEIRDRGRYERQRVDIDINIGVGIPQAVVLQPLPPTVISLVPAYRGYLFFVMADGTIVIVDPDTRQVVYLIA